MITIYRNVKRNSNDIGIEEKIVNFFKQNPNPEDKAVHNIAESEGIDPDVLEAKIYQFVSALLSGGLSFEKDISHISDDKIKQGIEVEMEHVDKNNPFSIFIARKIEIDHLIEDIDYYDKLAKIEGK